MAPSAQSRHRTASRTPRSVRIAATVVAAALPVTAVAVSLDGGTPGATASPAPAAPATGPAVINDAFPTRDSADTDTYVPSDESVWRDAVYDDAGNRLPNVEELKVHSPAMDRDIPVVTIRAKEDAANAPTIYLLNGADGGSGKANWLSQTTAIDFYGNRIGNVNVVIPMSGGFSYYTDWQQESGLDGDGNGNGGVQKWETFLTSELPGAMEQGHLGTSSDKRAIVGMSMTGSTSLVYAEHNPGMYDAVGSYSGCPATSGAGATAVDATLAMKGTGVTYEQMWGDRNGATARYNDAQVNVAELGDQQNIYVSSGTGLLGEHDVWSSPDVNRNLINESTVAGQGSPIEAVTNGCTHMFKAAADKAGVSDNITWNFHNTGTHQWAYWREDMYQSWPTLSAGLFGPESVADAQAVGDQAYDDYHSSL
ncbi:MAG: alpha/beta hydrolase [Corynebacterium variabile]|uniref:alpha/beta hydrolase n=1 Tax=Corynebacterium variabile TaxID=1727 RepID=UPI003F937B6C